MSVLFILIPLSLVMGAAALYVFSRCARSGEFEVLDQEWSKLLGLEGENK